MCEKCCSQWGASIRSRDRSDRTKRTDAIIVLRQRLSRPAPFKENLLTVQVDVEDEGNWKVVLARNVCTSIAVVSSAQVPVLAETARDNRFFLPVIGLEKIGLKIKVYA